MLSYGVRYPAFKDDEAAWRQASRELRLRLPRSHRRVLEDLELCAERGPYYFVHAGVDPDRALDDQREGDLMWIREPFLDDNRLLERIIVHGHTPQAAPSADERRIGLDLGGVPDRASRGGTYIRRDGESADLLELTVRSSSFSDCYAQGLIMPVAGTGLPVTTRQPSLQRVRRLNKNSLQALCDLFGEVTKSLSVCAR